MTIAEVAKRYGITPDTLRYYERIKLLPKIARTAGGIRRYGEEDCRWVEYVSLFHQGKETIPARKRLLLEQREQILARIQELNDVLARLDWKLDGYEERMLKYEEKLK